MIKRLICSVKVIEVELGILIFSSALALTIALLMVSYQSIRAALANPVHSLRYE